MVKNVLKRSFCTILSLVLVLSCFCFTNLFRIDTSAAVTVTPPTTATSTVAFYVPEVIYLYPNATSFRNATSTPFQWYVQNTVNTSDIYAQPVPNAQTQTTGSIYFAYPTASNVTLSYRFVTAPSSGAILSGGSVTLASATPARTGNYFTTTITNGQSPSLAYTTTGCYIEWTATYTDSADGLTKAAVAYTYVYKPYVTPYAGAAEARYDTHNYASSITWLSGYHSFNPAMLLSPARETDSNAHSGPNLYSGSLCYTGEYGFSAFISPSNKAYLDSTAVTSTTTRQYKSGYYSISGTTSGYLSFAESGTSNPWFNTHPDDYSPSRYYNTGAMFPTPSFEHVYAYGDDYTTVMTSSSHAANLFIDTSRYTNLAQIPNLSVGLLVTDNEGATTNSSNWYLASYTDRTGNRSDRNGVDCNNYKSNTSWDEIFRDHGTIFFGYYRSTSGESLADSDSSEGVYYAGAWPEAISTTALSKLYRVKGLYNNKHSGNAGMSSVILNLNATQLNKANLRKAVATATAKFAALGIKDNTFKSYHSFSGTSLQNFVTLYQKAYGALTTVDKYYAEVTSQATMDTLATELTNAVNALSPVPCKVVIDHESQTSHKLLRQESATYKLGDTISIRLESISGYSFAGYHPYGQNTLISASPVTLSKVTDSALHYVLVYSPITYNVSFSLDGGTTTSAPSNTFTIENPLVFPNATKEGYVFAGWKEDNSTNTAVYRSGTTFTGLRNVSFRAVWVEEHTHVPTVVPAVPATCIRAGLTEGSVCSVCNQVLTAQQTVPMLAHTYDAAVTTPATCIYDGVMLYTCSVCSDTKEEPITAYGHDFDSNFTVDKTPTCIDEGTESRHCQRCDATTEDRIIPATGHIYDDDADMICNVCGNDRTPISKTPTLKLSNVSAKCGEQIDVALSIENNPGIISAFVKVSYDNTKLRLVNVTNGDVMADSTFTKTGTLSQIPFGMIWEDGLSTENNLKNGTLGVLTFEVLEDAEVGETPITLEYNLNSTLNVDLEDVPFTLEDGSVNISVRVAADANGDGEIDLRDIAVLQRYLCGGWDVEVDESNADVNADGALDLKDVVIMRRFLAGWDVVLK